MSSYIECKLSDKNEFRVPIEFSIDGKHIRYLSAKIDTGAVNSFFPIKSLSLSDHYKTSDDDFYRKYKQELLDNGVRYRFSKGIIDYIPSSNSVMDMINVTFLVGVENFIIKGIELGDMDVRINCDTTGNVLIGMDILKMFDFHCGLSEENGKYIFLGCLRDKITPEYINTLEKHFGYLS